MKITILGLSQVGKTTIFNAVTKGDIKVIGYSNKVNIGVAKVPDYRLDNLTDLYNPKRTVQAEITYSELPFLSDGLGKSDKIAGEYLNLLQQSDVLMLVARAFSDLSIPHFGDQIDPYNELNTLLYELIFADLEILERRISKLNSENKSVKKNERDRIDYELGVLSTFKNLLDDGIPGRDHNFSDKEMKLLSRFQFLLHQLQFLLHQLQFLLHQLQFLLHQLQFLLHQLQFLLHQLKFLLHQLQFLLHQLRFLLHQLQFLLH